jgi:imidazolonepropionase
VLVIRNIGELILAPDGTGPVVNTSELTRIRNAFVSIDGDRIVAFGLDEECIVLDWFTVIDAEGGVVTPGLIDCHTHTVFAGSREDEFVKRIRGMSYAQIAEEGGGIKTTVHDVRAAGVDELVALALPRLGRMLAGGVTTIEIKSGYGLSAADEIKMLEAAVRLGDLQPIEIVTTYLGAHTIPADFAGRRRDYIDLVISDALMGHIAREGLASRCDVFCEKTAFTFDESREILLAAKAFGLAATLHADQITQIGASRLAAEVGAVSADHLETIDAGGIEAMKEAGVIGVLLPGCSFFLGVEQAPARTMIEAGLPVALATDYNPGSSMVESLPLVMSIACTQMHMTPTEALIAVTTNAAAALNLGDRVGGIREGAQADLLILDVPNVDRWLYHVGCNCVKTVIKKGRVVSES